MTSQEAYALERGVRLDEGIVRGVDSEGTEVTVSTRHVLAYSVAPVEEQGEEQVTEEDGCNS